MADKEAQTNKEKLEWHLLWEEGLEAAVRVMMQGKKKYGANNWRTGKPFKKEEILNAIRRHYGKLMRGEEIDECGEGHWANIICEALFYGYYETHSLWNRAESEMMTEPQIEEPIELPIIADDLAPDDEEEVVVEEDDEEERGLKALEALIAEKGGDTRPNPEPVPMPSFIEKIRRKYA